MNNHQFNIFSIQYIYASYQYALSLPPSDFKNAMLGLIRQVCHDRINEWIDLIQHIGETHSVWIDWQNNYQNPNQDVPNWEANG